MLHRLYLSLLWLLIAMGGLTVAATVTIQVHDHSVLEEARKCFLSAKDKQGERLMDLFNAERDLLQGGWGSDAAAEAERRIPEQQPEQCAIHRYSKDAERTWEIGEYFSTRAWVITSLTATYEPRTTALSLLAFLPAVAVMFLRRWWRWVRYGSPPAAT
ncbi:hypothetical protein [Hyalangium versicolor]|uniref:hypothetical protein n=1 Tax=Hyalangium versicolor TaxID=2861190 RepID=UPI001CCEF325|nr:hypothetical protein [Hyalangium versicolor]